MLIVITLSQFYWEVYNYKCFCTFVWVASSQFATVFELISAIYWKPSRYCNPSLLVPLLSVSFVEILGCFSNSTLCCMWLNCGEAQRSGSKQFHWSYPHWQQESTPEPKFSSSQLLISDSLLRTIESHWRVLRHLLKQSALYSTISGPSEDRHGLSLHYKVHWTKTQQYGSHGRWLVCHSLTCHCGYGGFMQMIKIEVS